MWVECVGLGWRGLDQQWVLPQGLVQRTVQELSPISPLPCAPSTSRLPGNIDSLKDCPLTSLNLYNCDKLEGMTFGDCEPSYPPRSITLCKVLPQAITLNANNGNPSRNLLYFSSPFLHLPHCPRRHRGVQGHGTHQLGLVQLQQAHRCVWSWVGYGRWGQDWKQVLPQAITRIRFWELSSPSPSQTFFLVSISGDIGAFANMPLKTLNMEYCGYNTSTGESSITGESCSQQGVAPGHRPH